MAQRQQRGLQVGPTYLRIEAERGSLASWPPRFRAFAPKRGATPEISLRLHRKAPPRPGARVFKSDGVWSVYEQPDGRLLYSYQVSGAVYKALLIDKAMTTGDVFFPVRPRGVRGPLSAMQYPLDELLFQHRWSRTGLLEVHCCGIVDRGGTLLFTGHSGAGKTTTARLWNRMEPKAKILSDDRVLLDPRARSDVDAWGTPWHGAGSFALNVRAPLQAIFFLEQAAFSEAERVHPAEAASRLFSRSFPPIWDHAAVETTLETCAKIVESVPAFVLRFRKDRSAIEAARAAVRTITRRS